MKISLPTLLLLLAASFLHAEDKKVNTVYREPFTLTLQMEKGRTFEEKLEKIPYVKDNEAYLFRGDSFGLMLDIQGGVVKGITYQPDLTKADVTLKFSQEITTDQPPMMMLILHNNTKYPLELEALMSRPGREGLYKTSILPLGPGLSNYESWPHPIVELILHKIQIGKAGS